MESMESIEAIESNESFVKKIERKEFHMKHKKHIVTLLLALLFFLSPFGINTAVQAEEDKIDVLNQEETMSVDVAVLTGHTKPDSQVEQWLEEKYNIDINLILLPGWADAQSKITLMMADPDARPDIIWWWAMDQEYVKWVDAGLLVDVAPYMDKYAIFVITTTR